LAELLERVLASPALRRLGVGLGVALRLWQYLANASLWVDEAALARNVRDRSWTQLFAPLDYAQVAPPLFLAIEKGLLTLLGGAEWVLRLPSLVAGLLALLLFRRVCERCLTATAASLAVIALALGAPFVFISSQVKPYSVDVAAALLVVWTTLEARRLGFERTQALRLGLLGLAIVWVSQASVLVLAGVGAALVVLAACSVLSPRVAGVVALWSFGALAAVAWGRRSLTPADADYMRQFWARGFMPSAPGAAGLWLFRLSTGVFGAPDVDRSGLGYPLAWAWAVLSCVGMLQLVRRDRATALVLLSPLVAALGASVAGLYPCGGRLRLYLVPLVLISLAAGVEAIGALMRGPFRGAGGLLGAGLVAVAALVVIHRPPAYRPEHVRPLLESLAAARRPGDAIYVYYGAGQSFLYYAPRLGLGAGDYRVGNCHRDEPREYLRELDGLRGERRAWLVTSHVFRASEAELLADYLGALGTLQFRQTAVEGDAAIALYELGGAASRIEPTAEAFRVPAATPGPAWRCYGVLAPLSAPPAPPG